MNTFYKISIEVREQIEWLDETIDVLFFRFLNAIVSFPWVLPRWVTRSGLRSLVFWPFQFTMQSVDDDHDQSSSLGDLFSFGIIFDKTTAFHSVFHR